MAYNAVPTVTTGDLWTASNHNTYIRDNLAALFPYLAAGDLATAANANSLQRIAAGAVGTIFSINGSNMPAWAGIKGSLPFVFNDGGGVLEVGERMPIEVPFDCEITGVTLLAIPSGSVVVDIWKDTLANFPPTVEDSICAAAKPTLSSAATGTDTTLEGWTKTLSKGDVLLPKIESCTTITKLTMQIHVLRKA